MTLILVMRRSLKIKNRFESWKEMHQWTSSHVGSCFWWSIVTRDWCEERFCTRLVQKWSFAPGWCKSGVLHQAGSFWQNFRAVEKFLQILEFCTSPININCTVYQIHYCQTKVRNETITICTILNARLILILELGIFGGCQSGRMKWSW